MEENFKKFGLNKTSNFICPFYPDKDEYLSYEDERGTVGLIAKTAESSSDDEQIRAELEVDIETSMDIALNYQPLDQGLQVGDENDEDGLPIDGEKDKPDLVASFSDDETDEENDDMNSSENAISQIVNMLHSSNENIATEQNEDNLSSDVEEPLDVRCDFNVLIEGQNILKSFTNIFKCVCPCRPEITSARYSECSKHLEKKHGTSPIIPVELCTLCLKSNKSVFKLIHACSKTRKRKKNNHFAAKYIGKIR